MGVAPVDGVASARGAVVVAARVAIFCCICAFIGLTIATGVPAFKNTEFYTAVSAVCWTPFLNDSLTRAADIDGAYEKGPLWAFEVWYQWLLTLLVALLTFLIRYVLNSSKDVQNARRKAASHAANPRIDVDSENCGNACMPESRTSIAHMAKRILCYQLPPRAFLAEWCGGLCVIDALLVAAWLALNVVIIEQRVATVYPMLRAIFDAGIAFEGHVWTPDQERLDLVSGALGRAAMLNMMLLFYPIARSSFLQWLWGANFPHLIRYHRWLGHGTMWLLTLHGLGFYINWITEGDWRAGLVWNQHGVNMLCGLFSWLSGMALWMTSMEYVRRHYFEVFYRMHIIGFLGFIIFGFMHRTSMWAYIMPGLVLYFMDVGLRVMQQSQSVMLSRANVAAHRSLITLHLPGNMFTPARPVQEIFMRVEGLSPLQWHPFTVIPGAGPGALQAIVKGYGSWTQGLIERLWRNGQVRVWVDGPYGGFPEPPEWLHYRVLAIFAGGIGVTPILGMVQDLNVRHRATRGQANSAALPTKVHLVYAASTRDEMDLMACAIITEARAAGWLEVTSYCTNRAQGAEVELSHESCVLPHAAAAVMLSDSAADLSNAQSATTLKLEQPQAVTPARRGRATLVPFDFGLAHMAAAHVLCYVGAFGGAVVAFAYVYYNTPHAFWHPRPGAREGSPPFFENKSGPPDWLVGLLMLLGTGLGAMLLPVLATFPLHVAWNICTICNARQHSVGTPGAAAAAQQAATLAKLPKQQPAEAAHAWRKSLPALQERQRRPDVAAHLADICAAHANELSIGVFVAGPERLVRAVSACCVCHNDSVGLCGRPYLDSSKHTYSL